MALPHVRLTGDIEGDYVVLEERAGGVLRIGPERPDGLPTVKAMRKTSTACPSQWEGTLEDGGTVCARYRWGELSVGIGEDLDAAVKNGMSDEALYADHVGEGLDGFMDFEELRTYLHGLLEFPADLNVENEHEPSWDLKAVEKLLAARPSPPQAPS